FRKVFEMIDEGNIGVLPIENSYAGSVHENFYHIISGNYYIIGEIFLDINHFLLANTTDISGIKEAYSHPQALLQCQNYLQKLGIKPISFGDTAGAAKFISESKRTDIASISSDFASNIYKLNILDKSIQDQNGNTTRFFVIVRKDIFEKEKQNLIMKNNGKISIKFKTKDTPSALYKCLGAFATRFINLTKIESLPARENRFEYIFWIDFQKNVEENIIKDALEELKFFSKDLVILGDY
ncbi:MAG: prephenate dehydratase domain-containing protein, partial [Candidatus Gracilibacteria bacterium]|nr:prephenate dehydratase domain-containing protein [Candidatus Gracilibacteria bacterium]